MELALLGAGVAGTLLLAFLFGALLKVSDLLQEHGFTWIRGGDLLFGVLAALVSQAMLYLADDALRIFWLSIVLNVMIRGRIDGINHGVTATAMLLFVILSPVSVRANLFELTYFLCMLVPLDIVHDQYQYRGLSRPRWLLWIVSHQHLYWYLAGFGYQALFELNGLLLCSLFGFVKGYGFFYEPRRYRLLQRIGIQPPPPSTVA